MKYFNILILILISACTGIFAQNSNTEEVRFILFGDSQFGNPPEFERMIHEADMLNPNFAIQVGDLIHGYTKSKEQLRSEWKRYKQQISPLNAPFYPVPGNHDVVTDEAEEVYAEVWGKEKLLYSFDFKHAHFIVLNSWWQEADDRIEKWQRNWLVEDLKKYAGKFGSEELKTKSIFVFLHSPLWKYPKEQEGKKDWDEVHKILKDYPVKLVTAGHSHEYVLDKKDDINYLIINSAGVSRPSYQGGKFSSFMHISVLSNGEVKYGNIKAGSVLPLDSVNPEERNSVPKYNIHEQTIQVPDWKEGSNFTMNVTAPIINSLDHERRFRLDWYIPFGDDVTITPESKWIEVSSKDTVNVEFTISTENAPSADKLPWLDISSKQKLRTGYVNRNLEAMYRNNPEQSSVILDEEVEFKGKYYLFIPPIVTAKKLANEINVDGKLNDDEWMNAGVIENLNISSKEESDIKTKVNIYYDEHYLYVGARLDEPNTKELRTEAGGDIPLTWDDDDFELFFDPAQSQSDYIRLFQNAAGTRFNSLPRWHPDKYFQSEYESAIEIGDNYWSIEMKIPWSDISVKKAPNSGETWGFNVGRHRQQSYTKRSKWSGNLYNPKIYGILKFE